MPVEIVLVVASRELSVLFHQLTGSLKGAGASWVLKRNYWMDICPYVMHQLSQTRSIQGLFISSSLVQPYVTGITHKQTHVHTNTVHRARGLGICSHNSVFVSKNMCVSVLDGERERDTSPSGIYMNHV